MRFCFKNPLNRHILISNCRCAGSHNNLRPIHSITKSNIFIICKAILAICIDIKAFLLRIVVSILCGDASSFLMKEKVIKNTNLLGGWGGRVSLTLLADEFKKSKLVLGLKELRFKNSHQVSYKGGL